METYLASHGNGETWVAPCIEIGWRLKASALGLRVGNGGGKGSVAIRLRGGGVGTDLFMDRGGEATLTPEILSETSAKQ